MHWRETDYFAPQSLAATGEPHAQRLTRSVVRLADQGDPSSDPSRLDVRDRLGLP